MKNGRVRGRLGLDWCLAQHPNGYPYIAHAGKQTGHLHPLNGWVPQRGWPYLTIVLYDPDVEDGEGYPQEFKYAVSRSGKVYRVGAWHDDPDVFFWEGYYDVETEPVWVPG